MRLVTFHSGDRETVGILEGNEILAVPELGGHALTMLGLIRQGEQGMTLLKQAKSGARRLPLADVKLLAPIPRPQKNIFCVGKNYHEHAREFHASGFDASAGAQAVPEVPIIFTKPSTTVIGPSAPIRSALDPTESVDYENELAVVIGKGGRGIRKADAYVHVFGYTIVNDVTARVLQQRHKQWFVGKSIDTFCPMGPCILTADEARDVDAMHLVTMVNGEKRQDAFVKDLIFDIPTLIETISAGTTLEAGDIIATGTPAGVGIGFNPPRYLKPGDTVSVTIEPIGTLTNPIA